MCIYRIYIVYMINFKQQQTDRLRISIIVIFIIKQTLYLQYLTVYIILIFIIIYLLFIIFIVFFFLINFPPLSPLLLITYIHTQYAYTLLCPPTHSPPIQILFYTHFLLLYVYLPCLLFIYTYIPHISLNKIVIYMYIVFIYSTYTTYTHSIYVSTHPLIYTYVYICILYTTYIQYNYIHTQYIYCAVLFCAPSHPDLCKPNTSFSTAT